MFCAHRLLHLPTPSSNPTSIPQLRREVTRSGYQLEGNKTKTLNIWILPFPPHLFLLRCSKVSEATLTGKHPTWPTCWPSVTLQMWSEGPNQCHLSHFSSVASLLPPASWHFYVHHVPLYCFIIPELQGSLVSSKVRLSSWLVHIGSC